MNLRRLAFKNIWQSRGRYLAYLGSAVFSVAIYFLYTALTYHPELRSGFYGAQYVSAATGAAAVVIAVFTFLFLLYSSAAFVRYRMKEFGLLSLVGFTRGQLVRMILWENLIIAVTALAIGLGAGLLLLKLFFMAVSALLRLPRELPLYAGAPVWLQTVAVFGSSFAVVSLVSLRGVLRRSVVQLIQARRQPKGVPSYSHARAAAGLGLVALGYAWASAPSPMTVIAGVIPVTAIVSLGTYLLLREGSVALLGWLHRSKRFFYRPRPFLVVSQLVFRVQENYRVLTAVSLLIAVILSAVGTAYSLFVVVADDVQHLMPQAVQLEREAAEDPGEARVEAVREILARHGVPLAEVRVELFHGELGGEEVYVIPYGVYRSLYRPHGQVLPLSRDGQGIVVHPFPGQEGDAPPARAQLVVGNQRLSLDLVHDGSGRLFNGAVGLTEVVVVSDSVFQRLKGAQPQAGSLSLAVWTGPGWRGRAMEAAVREIAERADLRDQVTTTLQAYHDVMSGFGLALFIAVFVSLVFFAATCSLLYFRLFTEVDDDRRYFGRLYELGVDAPEVRRLSRIQNGVVFLVPFAVGLLHSTFAMKALSTLMSRPVLTLGWLVAAAYLVIYALFFAVTDGVYQRAVAAERWRPAPTA